MDYKNFVCGLRLAGEQSNNVAVAIDGQ